MGLAGLRSKQLGSGTWRPGSKLDQLLLASLLICRAAGAELAPIYTFEGNGGWSIDGGGRVLGIDLEVPLGSTIEIAYLYCGTALAPPAPPGVSPTVVLSGVTYGPTEFVQLPWVAFPGYQTGMQAFRADATSQIRSLLAGGVSGPIQLQVESASTPTGRTTGQLVAVVFRNPLLDRRHITLLAGPVPFVRTALQVDLPERSSHAGATSLLSIGIGYSTGNGDQKTILEVNGRRLTSIAGGADDHPDLLTVGGQGDSSANPPDPYASPSIAGNLDDELYDLSLGNSLLSDPFIGPSDAELTIDSANASDDDHLYFAALNLSLPPEPSILQIPTLDRLGLIGLASGIALASLGVIRSRHRVHQ